MRHPLVTAAQCLDILLITLIAGSVFGIWRGYNPATYSALTFLEVHQGAVRGLNLLLPAMGLAAILLTALLAILVRKRRGPFRLYIAALVAVASAAMVTRLFNQPINAEIMTWTTDAIPEGWNELRDTWWRWHIVRLVAATAGALLLIAAVFADRDTLRP